MTKAVQHRIDALDTGDMRVHELQHAYRPAVQQAFLLDGGLKAKFIFVHRGSPWTAQSRQVVSSPALQAQRLRRLHALPVRGETSSAGVNILLRPPAGPDDAPHLRDSGSNPAQERTRRKEHVGKRARCSFVSSGAAEKPHVRDTRIAPPHPGMAGAKRRWATILRSHDVQPDGAGARRRLANGSSSPCRKDFTDR